MLVVGTCFVLTQMTQAVIVDPPHGPQVTHQEWHFDTPFNPAAPEIDHNPFGQFPDLKAIVQGSVFMPDLQWCQGIWSDKSLTVTLDVPNFPVQNPYKMIHVTMRVKGDLMLSWVKDMQGNDFPYLELVRSMEESCGGWYILRDTWRIEPNPNAERLCYGFNGTVENRAAIDWIKVHTTCVPEPASMTLLALGILMVRKKKK